MVTLSPPLNEKSKSGGVRGKIADQTYIIRLEGAVKTREDLLRCLQRIVSEQLGIREDEVTEKSTWCELGADSLERLETSRIIDDVLKVQIPHEVGERLNTVGETVSYLSTLITGATGEVSNLRLEAATTNQQWAEMMAVRTVTFAKEYGLSYKALPGPGETGVWHLLVRDNDHVVGTLSVVETTGDHQVHQRYGLKFLDTDRVARYAQLAILEPYRKRGIFEMLMESAQRTVLRPKRFTAGWLLYPASQGSSGRLKSLGFTAEASPVTTDFGVCNVLVWRESSFPRINSIGKSLPVVETCPI